MEVLCKFYKAKGKFMKRITIEQCPFNQNKFFPYSSLSFQKGLTVLVGCNGAGKSTILKNIKHHCKSKDIDYVSYDNQYDGADALKSKAGMYGDFAMVANLMCASEGEGISLAFGDFVRSLRNFIHRKNKNPEKWILIDALDSGFSIDNVLEVKKMFEFVMKDAPSDTEVFIVVSANTYEVANGEDCINVRTGKHIKFADYEEYKQTILDSVKSRNAVSTQE